MNHTFLSVTLTTLLCLSASAQSTEHVIESTRIQGTSRTSKRLIIAESRIEEGKSYSEKTLGESVRRINRLPFIFHTEFSLEKGEKEGNYILVIKVEETRKYRFGFTSTQFDTDDRLEESNGNLILSGRWFPGTGGSLYLGWKDETHWANDVENGGNFVFGYSHHDLFHKGVFLDVRLSGSGATHKREDSDEEWHSEGSSLTTTLAVPIKKNQQIRATWKDIRRDNAPFNHYREVFSEDMLPNYHFYSSNVSSTALSWEYDTRNDDFVTSEGRLARFGYRRVEEKERDHYWFSDLLESDGLAYENDQLFADFRQYTENGDHNSFHYGVHASYVETDGPHGRDPEVLAISIETRRGGLDLGYTWDIMGRKSHHGGQFRLELVGTADKIERDGSFNVYRAGASLSYRKPRYSFRLSYNYYDVDE